MQESDALRKIRSLLTLAENGATEHERQHAADTAQRLMGRYAVSEAMLDAARTAQHDPIEQRRVNIAAPYVREKYILLNTIAAAASCKAVLIHGSPAAWLIGHRSDLARVEFLFTLLLVQASRGTMACTFPPDWSARLRTAGRLRGIRRSFLVGFINAVYRRFEEGKKEATAEAGTGAELVLRDRKAAADDFAREAIPGLRDLAPVRATSAAGYAAGQRAGDRADLGHSRMSGQRRSVGA